MTARAQKIWLTLCMTAAGFAAVAIWTGSRTSLIYSQTLLQRVPALHDEAALLRSYERELASLRSVLSDTTFYAVAIVVLLFIAVAMIWRTETRQPEQKSRFIDKAVASGSIPPVQDRDC